MKKCVLMFMGLLSVATLAFASDRVQTELCLRYMFQPHTGEPRNPAWVLDGSGDQDVIVQWNITNAQPTFAEIQAVEADAIAWRDGTRKESQASLDDISPKTMKALLTAMIKVVNLRLPADKKITAQEMKDAIKAEL